MLSSGCASPRRGPRLRFPRVAEISTRFRTVTFLLLFSCLLELLSPSPARAQQQSTDLSSTSLEALTQIHISVTSFARKEEDLWLTPAAVFVITREDIVNSAASSIPELLRIVPGVQVAQINASSWAVSARGFNSVFANKLLVLIDGRTLYSEIYSGSHWDQIDLPLESIERIEVIRGPGAAVWGTNAVNGVVNIITRKPRGTIGLQASSSISRINRTAEIQFGSTLGRRAQYRAFASYINRNPFETNAGPDGFDGEDSLRGGGRLDWQKDPSNWIMLSGDLHGGHLKQEIQSEINIPAGLAGAEHGSIAGGYLLGRWERKSSRTDAAFQVYFDDQSRHELDGYGRTRTLDLDYQDHLAASARHNLVWGTEFRLTADHLAGAILPTTRPEYRPDLLATFLQDEITVIPGRLIITAGSKIQVGSLAGFQVQPSLRALWAPTESQTLWAAVSRAAVAPSIQDKYLNLPLVFGAENGIPLVGALKGNPMIKPEQVIAYELGYRVRPSNTLSLDLAGFVNENRRFQSLIDGPSTLQMKPVSDVFTPLTYTNGFSSTTLGVESSLSWKPSTNLSFQTSYTWMEQRNVRINPDVLISLDSWSSPQNAVSACATWVFAPRWSASGMIARVGSLPANLSLADNDEASSVVPPYTRIDLHLSHKVGRSLQLDTGATNLLTPRHWEFGNGTGFTVPYAVPRSAFVKASWSF